MYEMLCKFASLAQFYCDFSNLIGTLFQFLEKFKFKVGNM